MKRAAARPTVRAAPRTAPAVPPRAARVLPRLLPRVLPLALLGLGLAALLWTTRGAPLGVPVADDYAFLDRLHFQRPLEAFDSMGAMFYWRPLSRQVYFTLVGPFLLRAPWIVPWLSAGLLALLFALVYRIARRPVPAPAAAAIALFPLLTESARVLLDWPSGAQHLLAMVFAALAVHEALRGRVLTTGLALLAGLLSHESALVALPVAAWLLARKGRLRPALFLAAAVGGLWFAGYLVARSHGVRMPAPAPGAVPLAQIPGLLGRAVTAQLSLEDLREPERGVLVIGYGAVLAFAIAMLYERAARRRLRGAWLALVAAAAWFVFGTLPLVVLLPDWNAWRDSVPGLGFGFAVLGFLAVASPRLTLAFVGLKLVALLSAAPATQHPTPFPAVTTTDMSFLRLTRLQRIADDTRRALVERFPTLPAGADLHYASLPRMAEVGLLGPRAVRTWYGDSTLTWGTFTSAHGFAGPKEVVVAYDTQRRWAATVIEPAALRTFGQGIDAMTSMRLDAADSLLPLSRTLQPRRSDEFESLILANQARIALSRQQYPRADSLINGFMVQVGRCADYYALEAGVFMGRGRLELADQALAACFKLEPRNRLGLVVQDGLARVRATLAKQQAAGGAPPPVATGR
jgi:hypothetical protein